jgi:hypothetical protein
MRVHLTVILLLLQSLLNILLGAQVGWSLDGLKLQDSGTGETVRVSSTLTRHQAAGRTFWILQRRRRSQPSTPLSWSRDGANGKCQRSNELQDDAVDGGSPDLGFAFDDDISGNSTGGSRSATGSSSKAAAVQSRRKSRGLTGEFTMPNMDLRELKGQCMISETIGKASLRVPYRKDTGLDRFSCPATAIPQLEPGETPANCWEEPPCSAFQVRGKTYVKVSALCVCVFKTCLLISVNSLCVNWKRFYSVGYCMCGMLVTCSICWRHSVRSIV